MADFNLDAREDPEISDEPELRIRAGRDMRAHVALACADLAATVALWRLCAMMAWMDIRLRYRGSKLGPFWLTLSTTVMVVSLGLVYGVLFKVDLTSYLPFLTLSTVLWNFMAAIITDGCFTFTQFESLIRGARLPFTLHAARMVLRNVLILGHTVVVILLVFVVMRTVPGRVALLALPAFALWLLVGMSVCLLLGALCARFRDLSPIVNSVMQLAFFVSGVIWRPEQMGDFERLLVLDPFYVMLEIVRGPLIGNLPKWQVYVSAGMFSAVIVTAAMLIFARVRARITFWV